MISIVAKQIRFKIYYETECDSLEEVKQQRKNLRQTEDVSH